MTKVADLLQTTHDLGLEAFIMAHPATALVVEPFAVTGVSPPRTRKLLRSSILGNPLLPEAEPHPQPHDEENTEETMVIRRDGGKPKKETWKRSPQGFLHPEARVVWLLASDHNQIPGILSLGRGRKNDLVFNNETVSKVHALLHRRQDHWLIEDHASANGTFLNGAPLPPYERRRLNERAAIRLGDSIHATLFGAEALFRFCGLLRSIQQGQAEGGSA